MKISYFIFFVLSFISIQLVAENCNLNDVSNNYHKHKEYFQESISNEFDTILSVDDDLLSFGKRNELSETIKAIFNTINKFSEYSSGIFESEEINPLLSDIPPPSVD